MGFQFLRHGGWYPQFGNLGFQEVEAPDKSEIRKGRCITDREHSRGLWPSRVRYSEAEHLVPRRDRQMRSESFPPVPPPCRKKEYPGRKALAQAPCEGASRLLPPAAGCCWRRIRECRDDRSWATLSF